MQEASRNRNTDNDIIKGYPIASIILGSLFIIIDIIIMITKDCFGEVQSRTFIILMAIGCAGFAAAIPGFIRFKYKGVVSAGGAIAVFAIIFFGKPGGIDDFKKCENKKHIILHVFWGKGNKPADGVKVTLVGVGSNFAYEGKVEFEIYDGQITSDSLEFSFKHATIKDTTIKYALSDLKNSKSVNLRTLSENQPKSNGITSLMSFPTLYKDYQVVKLRDGKTWFAENLNYDLYPIRSEPCYYYNQDYNNSNLGRLYPFQQVSEIEASLPQGEGWRIPTEDDYKKLLGSLGHENANAAYNSLIKSGFGPQCAGTGDYNGPKSWKDFGFVGYYLAIGQEGNAACIKFDTKSKSVSITKPGQTMLMSIRLVKD